MDVFSAAERSRVMAAVRSARTKPELRLAEAVRVALPRHKILLNDATLPGRPDVSVPGLKLAIFVDGCFWHRCPVHGEVPASRVEYWLPKLERNRRRDARIARQLRAMGWSVWRVWEHDLTIRRMPHTSVRLARRLGLRAANVRAARALTG